MAADRGVTIVLTGKARTLKTSLDLPWMEKSRSISDIKWTAILPKMKTKMRFALNFTANA